MNDSPKAANSGQSPTSRQMKVFRQVMIEGRSRESVALAEEVTERTIQKYVRQVEQWLAVQVVTLESLLVGNVHLERLEHQWNELMAAWNQSKQDQVVSKASTDHEGRRRAEQTRKTCTGDVRYLEQARRVLADIRALLNLQHLPTEQELIDDAESLTLEQRMALLDRLLQKVSHTAAAQSNLPTDRGKPAAADPTADQQQSDAA